MHQLYVTIISLCSTRSTLHDLQHWTLCIGITILTGMMASKKKPSALNTKYAQHVFQCFYFDLVYCALCLMCKSDILNLNLCELCSYTVGGSFVNFFLLFFSFYFVVVLSFCVFPSIYSAHHKWIVVLDITCWQIKYGSLFMHRIEWNSTNRQQTCYVDCSL